MSNSTPFLFVAIAALVFLGFVVKWTPIVFKLVKTYVNKIDTVKIFDRFVPAFSAWLKSII